MYVQTLQQKTERFAGLKATDWELEGTAATDWGTVRALQQQIDYAGLTVTDREKVWALQQQTENLRALQQPIEGTEGLTATDWQNMRALHQ